MSDGLGERKQRMRNGTVGVPLAIAMVVVIVGVDLLLFRSRTWFWERLAANVGIVLVFGSLYFRISRR